MSQAMVAIGWCGQVQVANECNGGLALMTTMYPDNNDY
jgi:hypothetical protein